MFSKRKPKSFRRTVRRLAKTSGVIRSARSLALPGLLFLTAACASSSKSESLEWKSVVPGRDTVAYAQEPGTPASVVPEQAAVSGSGNTALPASTSAEPPALMHTGRTEAALPESPKTEVSHEAVEVPPALDRTAASQDGAKDDELEEVERRARPLPPSPGSAISTNSGPEPFKEERFVPDPDQPAPLEAEPSLEVVRDPELEAGPEFEALPRERGTDVLPGVEEPVVAPITTDDDGPEEPAEWNDSVVARVNGAPILFSELKEYALDQNLPLTGLRVDGTRGDAFRQAMTARVDQTLLVQAATLEDMTANEVDVSRRVDAFIAQRIDEAGGRAEFLDRLRGSQLNLESFRSLLIKRETQRQLAAGIVQQRVTISSQELEAFKKRLEDEGEPAVEVQLAQILVSCPLSEQETEFGNEMFRKALDLAARAGRQPAAFSKILAEVNNDPTGRARGGLLGWIDPESLQPAIRDAVQELHPGEVSPPVKSDTGYHVLFVLERRDARDKLYSEKFEEQRSKLVNELRAKAQIEIYPIEGAG